MKPVESSSTLAFTPMESNDTPAPPPPPRKQNNIVSDFSNQRSVDIGYTLDHPNAAPTAQGSVAEQVKQAALLGNHSGLAAANAAGLNQDVAARTTLGVLDATPPDTRLPTEYTNYSSTFQGVSPKAAFDYFVKNPNAWFGASGITLHPPTPELKDGARVFLAEPGVTPPVFAPIEVHIDEASRTVRITTLDGHPLRGVNQFSFGENANGDCELLQSSAFQLSSFFSEQGSKAMEKAESAGVPGALGPIKRQHQIWELTHMNIADGALRR